VGTVSSQKCLRKQSPSGGRVWVPGGHKESLEGTKGRAPMKFEEITSSRELAQGVREGPSSRVCQAQER
jgi:hypothetical protein